MSLVDILGLIFGIAAPGSVSVWLYRRWTRRTVVKRITDPTDRDLDRAFVLYEQLLPNPNVRDSSEEILRWLQEMREEQRQRAGCAEFIDYLIIVKNESAVRSFFYADFHPASGLLFVDYLVSCEPEATQAICRYLKRELGRTLRECRGIVFESEAPAPGQREDWRARFRLFQRLGEPLGIVLKRLDFPCRQPRLSLWDDSYTEQPQFLFYARTRPPPLGDTVPKDEVAHILDVFYNDWYGSSYTDEPEHDAQYRAYVRRLYESTVAVLPEDVPTLSRPLHRGSQGTAVE